MEGFRVCVQVPLVCFIFLSLFFFRNLKRERKEKQSKVFVLCCVCVWHRNGVVVLLMLSAKKYSIFNNELGLVLIKRERTVCGRHVSQSAFNQGRACEGNGRSESWLGSANFFFHVLYYNLSNLISAGMFFWGFVSWLQRIFSIIVNKIWMCLSKH